MVPKILKLWALKITLWILLGIGFVVHWLLIWTISPFVPLIDWLARR